MGTTSLNINEQLNLTGLNQPVVVNFPAGQDSTVPTGFRNNSTATMQITAQASAGEFFYEPKSAGQVASVVVTLQPGQAWLRVFVVGKGWVFYDHTTHFGSAYDLVAPTASIVGGAAPVALAWQVYGTFNPTADFTLLSGGTIIQVERPLTFEVDAFCRCEYTGGNNTEISVNVQLVPVAGIFDNFSIPLRDSFQTSRIGTFLRNWPMPKALVSAVAGNQFSIVAENEATSSMDLVITGALLGLNPK